LKVCSGTKFLKSSRLSQVVSELNNILNFPEVFDIFLNPSFPPFWYNKMQMAGHFFENGGLLTYSSVSQIFKFSFGTCVRSLPGALWLATPKKSLPGAGGGFLTSLTTIGVSMVRRGHQARQRHSRNH